VKDNKKDKKSSSESDSSDEESKKESKMDIDAIMKQKMKEYQKSLSPKLTKFGAISEDKPVFKIVQQKNAILDEKRHSDKSNSSSSDSR